VKGENTERGKVGKTKPMKKSKIEGGKRKNQKRERETGNQEIRN
jgi:hypothetical protein